MGKAARFVVWICVAGVAGGGAYYWNKMRALPEPDLYAECEAVLTARLKSPSSYRRISVWPGRKLLGWSDYEQARGEDLAAVLGADFDARVKSGEIRPVAHEVLFEYDADNGSGAAIRSVAKCSYLDAYGDGNVMKTLVRIDGRTRTQWLAESLTN